MAGRAGLSRRAGDLPPGDPGNPLAEGAFRACMDVVRLHGLSDLRLHTEAAPTPAPGEALVRVTAVGVCGSDLHWFGEAGIGDARLEGPLGPGPGIPGGGESPASPPPRGR